jgi:hypothetical protein
MAKNDNQMNSHRLDRRRKKKASNHEWASPIDPDARIAKMKDEGCHRDRGNST